MATLIVPPLDRKPWPTLGPELCDWIEANLVYGPGPKKGEPYVVEPEFRGELYRMYEVFPRGHARAGRRRFKRAALSKRKGTAKSEKGAIIAAAELHPLAPVRCDGFRRQGSAWVPVGRGVPSDPYVPMVAYTEEQSEDLAFGVLRVILGESPIADWFDIGLERILVLDDRGRAAGEAKALAAAPSARDGARTTFQYFDETHRMFLPRLKKAHTTMVANVFKLVDADAWTLETTTAGEPGELSIAEETHEYAELIANGKVSDPSLFFAHRQARPDAPLETVDEVRAALVEASGPAVSWSGDLDALVTHYFEPHTDRHYYRRVWLNQWVRGGRKAFDVAAFAACGRPGTESEPGRLVTVGFDGSRRQDSTGIVVTDVESGLQQMWWGIERPPDADEGFEIPATEVDAAMEEAFARWSVWRLYADPPYWDEWVDAWAGRWGPERVVKWWTNRDKPMAHALRSYHDAMLSQTVTHTDDARLVEHVGNCVRKVLPSRDAEDQPLWVIRKDRADSPRKIDFAMAAVLSWEARGDAVATGATLPAPAKSRTLRAHH
jgi:hypothetical protein